VVTGNRMRYDHQLEGITVFSRCRGCGVPGEQWANE
jgi:hypothetical protein